MERYEIRHIHGSLKSVLATISSQPGVLVVGGTKHVVIETTASTAKRLGELLNGKATVHICSPAQKAA